MNSGQPHDTLGPFRLLRVIASDASGIVYEASDPEIAQRLAVRVLPEDAVSADADAQARWRAGGLVAAGLQHPNIVAVHDCGWHGQLAFVATEFVDGETLAQYLARVGRLPAWQGLAQVAQLLSALAFAHGQGLVHGAVDPKYLLVSRSGQLKVTGFGWAAAAAAMATGRGLVDAPPYRAPEQVLGLQGDHRADLYSAAVVAYQLLTGTLPCKGTDGQAPGQHALRGRPRPVRAARPELPIGLDAVFQRALAQGPAERYQDAAELFAALQAALGSPVWQRPPVTAAAVRVDPPAEPLAFPAAAPIMHTRVPGAAPGAPGRWLGVFLVALILAGSLMDGEPSPGAPANTVPIRSTTAERHRQEQAAAMERPVALASTAPLSVPPVAGTPFAAPSAAQQAEEREPEVARRTPAVRPAAVGPVLQDRKPATRGTLRSQAARPPLNCPTDSVIERQVCIAFQCAKAEFRRHPVCVRIHEEQRARNKLAEARGGP